MTRQANVSPYGKRPHALGTLMAGTDGAPLGVLFLIVGPSGVGKDTLIGLASETLRPTGHFHFAQRTITRPATAGGEAHEPIDPDTFATLSQSGAFAVHWRAHDTSYGIRTKALAPLKEGVNVVVNGSRTAIDRFAALASNTVVLSITASPERVRARLSARGREDADAVAARLARKVAFPPTVPVIEIANDGPPEEGAARLLDAITGTATVALNPVPASLSLGERAVAILPQVAFACRASGLAPGSRVEVASPRAKVVAVLALDANMPAGPHVALDPRSLNQLGGGKVVVRSAPAPLSRPALRRKVAGQPLDDAAIGPLLSDLIAGRYSDAEAGAFIAAAARNLSVAETIALTKARIERLPRLSWAYPMVVDKHAIGGVPGSRISLIVVPIVAAHGLAIPKTSSRAITSAAGTADVMGCVAKVDLEPHDIQRVVADARGCLVSNARLVQSSLDTAVNAIARPLKLGSGPLDVSSILSKKAALGVTHTVIDIPVGAGAKVQTDADGAALAALFEAVGEGIGINVRAVVTDGTVPIGRGVGPLWELRDVKAVLAGEGYDEALRRKALKFAGMLLEFDPAVAPGTGAARAHELLQSGAAAAAFGTIVAAQGAAPEPHVPLFQADILADRAGTLAAINGFGLAGVAREAGAPQAAGAGLWLSAKVGDDVAAAAPLARVYAASEPALHRALAKSASVFAISS